jgi:hypothetical protein
MFKPLPLYRHATRLVIARRFSRSILREPRSFRMKVWPIAEQRFAAKFIGSDPKGLLETELWAIRLTALRFCSWHRKLRPDVISNSTAGNQKGCRSALAWHQKPFLTFLRACFPISLPTNRSKILAFPVRPDGRLIRANRLCLYPTDQSIRENIARAKAAQGNYCRG